MPKSADKKAPGTSTGNGAKRTRSVVELPKITNTTDTRDILAHAATRQRHDDYFIVDIDAHVTETAFWSEVIDCMDNEVYRTMARAFKDRGGSPPGLVNATPGMLYQDLFGRIPHQQRLAEAVPAGKTHAQVTLVQRAMDSLGIDYMVVFPTPILVLGMHPQADVEVAIGTAYNRWLTEQILPQDSRIKAMLYLPFNEPEACIDVVERFGDVPGVLGFTVTSTRYKAVHHDAYMPLYAAIQASGKPLGFHSGFHWGDQSMQQCNRFISMHALSFVHFNMVHMTNWIINGLPERFPRLKVIWIESGLAWVPFLMQRLDHEYMMRSSEAPLLRRRPSEYMADMYFTSQPLERSNLKLTEATFAAVKADTQLLFASDWPHWDFDLPSTITTLPFLDEQAKRNILGLNAARLFNLDIPKGKLFQAGARSRAARAGAGLMSRSAAAMPKTVTKPRKPTAKSPAKSAATSPARRGAAASDGDFVAQAKEALRRGEPDAITDAHMQNVLAAAVKLYAAKIERRGAVKPFRDGAVTATEAVVTACALIRAADLNLFDVAMWFNRPPAAS